MEAVTNLFELNWSVWLIGTFTILYGVTGVIKLIEEVSRIIDKPVKWIKNKNDDHNLLVKTAKDLEDLKNKHSEDIEESVCHKNKISEDLKNISEEIKESLKTTQKQMQVFTENRIRDREQSFAIQKQLTDSITAIGLQGEKRDKQIENLMVGTMELLGDKIDQKFSRYVELNGIPENEVNEFDSLYRAYAGTGGNSTRKHKYEYVKNNLRVIPVEVNLLKNDN